MSRPAGLEHDRGRRLLREECEEAITGEPSFVIDRPGAMRDGDLENRLCEIDGDGRMLHVDSSLPWPSKRPFHQWHDDAALAGGVHSIACTGRRFRSSIWRRV